MCHQSDPHRIRVPLLSRRRRCGTRTCASSSCRSRGSPRRTSTWTRTRAPRRSAAAPGWPRCITARSPHQSRRGQHSHVVSARNSMHMLSADRFKSKRPCAQRHMQCCFAGVWTEQAVCASRLQSAAAHCAHGELQFLLHQQQRQAWFCGRHVTLSIASNMLSSEYGMAAPC